jgi:hypothetical protein
VEPNVCDLCGRTRDRALRWRRLRFALGMTQMTGVLLSLVLLIELGVAPATLAAVVLTSAATALSVLLFGGRHADQ